MVEADVGHVVRWADMIMLIVGRVNTNGGEKWLCLVLDASGWEFAHPTGSLTYFRDIDFTERIA